MRFPLLLQKVGGDHQAYYNDCLLSRDFSGQLQICLFITRKLHFLEFTWETATARNLVSVHIPISQVIGYYWMYLTLVFNCKWSHTGVPNFIQLMKESILSLPSGNCNNGKDKKRLWSLADGEGHRVTACHGRVIFQRMWTTSSTSNAR